MRRTFIAATLAATFAAPLAAQNMQLSGTVTEAFGRQIILTAPEGRLLVTLPEGVEVPATGATVLLDGIRTGETFAARAVTATASAPAEPATAPRAITLPLPLRDLGLTDIRSRPDDDGETYYFARLPEGGWLRAEARGDRLTEVQSDGAALPWGLIAMMLPEATRAEPRLADIILLTEIDIDDDGEISVEGYAADGMRIEMEFARNGTLRDYERERDDRRSMSTEAARDRLLALGYTDIGYIERGGRHVEALAVNPYGEAVEVRLDEQGRVERERMWLR